MFRLKAAVREEIGRVLQDNNVIICLLNRLEKIST